MYSKQKTVTERFGSPTTRSTHFTYTPNPNYERKVIRVVEPGNKRLPTQKLWRPLKKYGLVYLEMFVELTTFRSPPEFPGCSCSKYTSVSPISLRRNIISVKLKETRPKDLFLRDEEDSYLFSKVPRNLRQPFSFWIRTLSVLYYIYTFKTFFSPPYFFCKTFF